MAQAENFSQGSNTSHGNNEAQEILDIFWEKEMDDIRGLGANDFKNQELPLARIKKIMKLDEDVKMISAEAPVLFAKAAEIFITELSLRAWVHTEDNKRRTLQDNVSEMLERVHLCNLGGATGLLIICEGLAAAQPRNDIAMAITKYDQFDFLIDIVPREELKPPKRQEENVRTAAIPPDQVQYYFQLAQQHQAALQQQQTSGVNQQNQQQIPQATPQPQQVGQIQLVPANTAVQQVAASANTQALSVQTASPTFSVPSVLQVQAVPTEAAQQQSQQAQVQVQQVQVQNAQQSQAQQVLQLQQPVAANQVNQAGGSIQIVQQFIGSNGEIQQIPVQINQNHLQFIRMQMQGQNTNQPIIIHAAPVQSNASPVQQTATQTVYQIQQVAQPTGQVATSATPVFLAQPGGGAAVQIQAVTADQHSSTDEEQQS